MEVRATDAAADHIRRRGGRLFVWIEPTRCAGRFLRAATDEPPRTLPFEEIAANGFTLLLRSTMSRRPEELSVELRGRRRSALVAYWDGCALPP